MKRDFKKPNDQVLQNQAKLIIKGAGLSLIKPKLFNVNVSKMAEEGNAFDPSVPTESYDKKSLFGTPIFDIVTIQQFSYEDDNGKTVSVAELSLDLALIEVTKPKNIVKTMIAGRNGTVKEYMGDGDYQITIRGVLTSDLAFSAPQDLIRHFNDVTKSPIELKVESNFLSYLDIYTIVIEDSKITQREGARNIVDYELQCVSETPFEIKFENDTSPSF